MHRNQDIRQPLDTEGALEGIYGVQMCTWGYYRHNLSDFRWWLKILPDAADLKAAPDLVTKFIASRRDGLSP